MGLGAENGEPMAAARDTFAIRCRRTGAAQDLATAELGEAARRRVSSAFDSQQH
jgi:hypothetical protein